MRSSSSRIRVVAGLLLVSGAAEAQQLPTSQPNIINMDHAVLRAEAMDEWIKIEKGFPAVLAARRWPDAALALRSLNHPEEVLELYPHGSQTEYASTDSAYPKDSATAYREDQIGKSERALGFDFFQVQVRGRPELSVGKRPDLAMMRSWQITQYAVRPGHVDDFVAAFRARKAVASRSGSAISYEVYEVMSGMPGPSFIVITTVGHYAGLDTVMASEDRLMRAATAEERSRIQHFLAQGCMSVETNLYSLDPELSYVSEEVRARDPKFWTAPKSP